MIIANVLRCFGTQIFQYTAGPDLALLKSVGLWLDQGTFTHNSFRLVNLFAQPASGADFRRVSGWAPTILHAPHGNAGRRWRL